MIGKKMIGKETITVSHAAPVEKSKTATAIYTFIGYLFGAAIGGPFLYAMTILLNQ